MPITVEKKLATGYKQTEIGMIPEDWDVKELGELFDVYDGTHQTPKYVPQGVPFYSVESITNDDFIDTKFITEAEHKLLTKKYKIEKDDILMTRIGSIGDCKLIDWLPRASFYVSLALLKPKNNLDSPFVIHFSKTAVFKKEIEDRSLQWAIPKKINLGEISKVKICVPKSESEKAQIALVLSDIELLIKKQGDLIEKKKNAKLGAMQELLTGKRRLPGFKGAWKNKNLGSLAHIKTGSRNNEDKIEDGKYPFFVRSSTVEKINSYSYDCEAILVPGEGNIGNIFHYIKGCFDVHQRVYAITDFEDDVSGKFIFYYMSKYFGAHAMQNTVKATVDSLRLPTFENFKLFIPTQKEEQTAIANVLSDMDSEIEKLESQLFKYQNIKQGMMQTLLTGKIRLISK